MESKKTDKKTESPAKLLAAIRVRGILGVRKPVEDTMRMLRLYKKNHCVIMEDNPSNKGMLIKVKDFVTFGEINPETLKLLAQKRKKEAYSSSAFKVFRLNPPKKGFGRKGIKHSFVQKGALGNRGEKINDLIQRMI